MSDEHASPQAGFERRRAKRILHRAGEANDWTMRIVEQRILTNNFVNHMKLES